MKELLKILIVMLPSCLCVAGAIVTSRQCSIDGQFLLAAVVLGAFGVAAALSD